MPCNNCDQLYKIRACEHPTGIVTYDDIPVIIRGDKNKSIIVPKIYLALHKYCPCKECLVKPICKTAVNCILFIDLLRKADAIKSERISPSN